MSYRVVEETSKRKRPVRKYGHRVAKEVRLRSISTNSRKNAGYRVQASEELQT